MGFAMAESSQISYKNCDANNRSRRKVLARVYGLILNWPTLQEDHKSDQTIEGGHESGASKTPASNANGSDRELSINEWKEHTESEVYYDR